MHSCECAKWIQYVQLYELSMKQIINILEQYGAELHTRQMMERLASSLEPNNEYLLDMNGVEQISRSAADELYNIMHGSILVEVINLEPFVEKMLSAVIKGRFLPRQYTANNTPIIHCATIESVQQQLMTR